MKTELDFWDKSFKDPNQWITNLINRSVDVASKQLLFAIRELKNPKVLDLGCGPISCLIGVPGIDLVGADPLVGEYNKILTKYKIPTQPNIECGGESIHTKFPAETFDVVHMRNAIDHSEDPYACINSLFKVLKTGGHFVLVSKVKEGTTANWDGMHRWDLLLSVGKHLVTCTNKAGVTNDLMCDVKAQMIISDSGDQWFSATWKKNA